MKLKALQLDLDWPPEVSLLALRSYLIAELRLHGEPLRWAITEIRISNMNVNLRRLKIEGIVITFSDKETWF